MKLSNDQYEVLFQEAGGEIASFKHKASGLEYMWQGDGTYWSGKNPTLFPMIGNTYTKTYTIHGNEYAMKNHGLIRYATLTCVKDDGNTVEFQLTNNEETHKQYPFSFDYRISYTLHDNKLTVKYHVTNTGDEVMPFSLGLHPAFRCPLEKDEKFEDYQIKFSNQEMLHQMVFDPAGKCAPVMKDHKEPVQSIPLTYEWIEKYATVIYKDIKSAYVTLSGKHHGVKMSCVGYPLLAFWTPKKGAPFICIEPWIGHGDFYDHGKDFYNRDYTMLLSAKKSYTCAYTIEVY